jgi:uncharacterized protein (DUF1697 family)
MRYVAFLRGINVGGRNLLRMESLHVLLAEQGLRNIHTYLQSGNVVFESSDRDAQKLAGRIEAAIAEFIATPIPVVLRTAGRIRQIIDSDPFRTRQDPKDAKLYVSFLHSAPVSHPKLPLKHQGGMMVILSATESEVFSVSIPSKGRYLFPNIVIEERFGVTSTTRDWNTMIRLARKFLL